MPVGGTGKSRRDSSPERGDSPSRECGGRPRGLRRFLLRRQHLHPATRLDGPGGLEAALEQLQGYATAAEFWESEVLPRRVRGYRTAWLDELLATGRWLWRTARDGRDEPAIALVPRDFAGEWRCHPDEGEMSADERQVLEVLAGRGAASQPTWRGSRVWSPRGCTACSAT